MTFMQAVFWTVALLGNGLAIAWLNIAPHGQSMTFFALTFLYTLVGTYDLFFSPHSLNRLYPVAAYIRYFLENFRKEIRQYFVASDIEELPFNREQRTLVYQRAKNIRDTQAFGSQQNQLAQNYLSLWHSLAPKVVKKEKQRVLIGGPQCTQPYSAAYLNVSAMSYGALSKQAIEALNLGARLEGFYHNTGEGSISPYHQKHGGDLVWQIGSGLFGCRHEDGRFDEKKFANTAKQPQVKMIEIKLSQGAKPAHGGVLPQAKINDDIAQVRGISKQQDCISPAIHPLASQPKQLLQTLQLFRQLSEGKPVGFKLCLGNPAEFLTIVKAMLETQILPDFITVDGGEGGTGAAPVEFSNRLGMGIMDSLYLINAMLMGAGLRDKIKLIAAGKTASSFDLLSKVAAGADIVNAARTMMMALGCIQSQACNTNECPTGVATQDPVRGRALHVPSKGQRVANFQRNTLHSFFELVGSLGLEDPAQLTANMIKQRDANGITKAFADTLPQLAANSFLQNADELPEPWKSWWQQANSESYYVKDDIATVKYASG